MEYLINWLAGWIAAGLERHFPKSAPQQGEQNRQTNEPATRRCDGGGITPLNPAVPSPPPGGPHLHVQLLGTENRGRTNNIVTQRFFFPLLFFVSQTPIRTPPTSVRADWQQQAIPLAREAIDSILGFGVYDYSESRTNIYPSGRTDGRSCSPPLFLLCACAFVLSDFLTFLSAIPIFSLIRSRTYLSAQPYKGVALSTYLPSQ